MTVDLTKVSPLQDLLIGFYSGTSAGAGFTSMTLDVKINGVDHNKNFTTVAGANAFFNNSGKGSAVDYGQLSGSSLTLDISLSITESAGGGYDFGMLIGDPPPSSRPSASGAAWGGADAAAHLNMVAAMSSFGAGGEAGNASSGTLTSDHDDDHRPKLAGNSA
jgi:hypothetical protein